MTPWNLVSVIGPAILLFTAIGNLFVSMALRRRDREDFERLLKEHSALRDAYYSLSERVARLETKAGK